MTNVYCNTSECCEEVVLNYSINSINRKMGLSVFALVLFAISAVSGESEYVFFKEILY